MVCIKVLSFIFTTVDIYMSSTAEVLYVVLENFSCPCATLSEYLLDNGKLPVVSNVEYHILPGSR